jgi:hypothetical protein
MKQLLLVLPVVFILLGVQYAHATGDVTLQIRVSPSATDWSMAYGGLGGISTMDGSGNKDVTISACDIYSANAQIKSDNGGALTLSAVEDGNVINTQSTNAQFGVVSVSGQC